MAKRYKWVVSYDRGTGRVRPDVTPCWRVTVPDGTVWWRRTKAECVTMARDWAKAAANGGQETQLVVKGTNGRIQYEYTYPRKSDPVRFKG